MTPERRAASRQIERKTGLNGSPVGYLARQPRQKTELISASLDVDVAELRPHMMLVADSMPWLALKRDELDSVFVNSSLTILSIQGVEDLMGAASVKFT